MLYRSFVLKCKPKLLEPFFELFAKMFESPEEKDAFENIYDFPYPSDAPEVISREQQIKHHTDLMKNNLIAQSYVIITGAGVSASIVSDSDADSKKCAGSWDGLITVLKSKIENFIGLFQKVVPRLQDLTYDGERNGSLQNGEGVQFVPQYRH
jgi:hypothetical protein